MLVTIACLRSCRRGRHRIEQARDAADCEGSVVCGFDLCHQIVQDSVEVAAHGSVHNGREEGSDAVESEGDLILILDLCSQLGQGSVEGTAFRHTCELAHLLVEVCLNVERWRRKGVLLNCYAVFCMKRRKMCSGTGSARQRMFLVFSSVCCEEYKHNLRRARVVRSASGGCRVAVSALASPACM
jgi:hypothetical protein